MSNEMCKHFSAETIYKKQEEMALSANFHTKFIGIRPLTPSRSQNSRNSDSSYKIVLTHSISVLSILVALINEYLPPIFSLILSCANRLDFTVDTELEWLPFKTERGRWKYQTTRKKEKRLNRWNEGENHLHILPWDIFPTSHVALHVFWNEDLVLAIHQSLIQSSR